MVISLSEIALGSAAVPFVLGIVWWSHGHPFSPVSQGCRTVASHSKELTVRQPYHIFDSRRLSTSRPPSRQELQQGAQSGVCKVRRQPSSLAKKRTRFVHRVYDLFLLGFGHWCIFHGLRTKFGKLASATISILKLPVVRLIVRPRKCDGGELGSIP